MRHSSGSTARQRTTSSDHREPELAQPGDWIEVNGTPGAGPRRGEILEVIGTGSHLHFRVRWDEEHESLLYPAPEGGFVVHAKRPASPR